MKKRPELPGNPLSFLGPQHLTDIEEYRRAMWKLGDAMLKLNALGHHTSAIDLIAGMRRYGVKFAGDTDVLRKQFSDVLDRPQ